VAAGGLLHYILLSEGYSHLVGRFENRASINGFYPCLGNWLEKYIYIIIYTYNYIYT
jgi:hypothetical protein